MIFGFALLVIGYAVFYWGWHHFNPPLYSLWALLGFGTLFKRFPMPVGTQTQLPQPGQPPPSRTPTGPQGRVAQVPPSVTRPDTLWNRILSIGSTPPPQPPSRTPTGPQGQTAQVPPSVTRPNTLWNRILGATGQ